MQRPWLTLVAVVAVFVLAQGIAQAQSIQGTWRLEGAESTGANPTMWESPQGQIMLGETTYCLFSVYPTRQPLAPAQMPGSRTDAEDAAAAAHWAPVIASCGTYDYSGTTLTLSPEYGKTEPPDGLAPTTTEITFEGDNATSAVTGQGVTKWTRVE